MAEPRRTATPLSICPDGTNRRQTQSRGLKNEQVVHGLIQIANDGFDESAPSMAEVKRTFGGMMRSELIEAQDSLAIETGIRKFIEWIRSDKLEVKLYREQNIHAKVYIMVWNAASMRCGKQRTGTQ